MHVSAENESEKTAHNCYAGMGNLLMERREAKHRLHSIHLF